ncbi:MAG: GTPase Era, partial [Clostridia bacterium]|nr:GTPase Era [Clostridia bacterium]
MKSGTVAVIGRANAGKSTLVNALVGEKVAIVSPKPQTTRDRILGILTREDCQIVFADTPGIYKQRNELTRRMMHATEETAKEVDMILFVSDVHEGLTADDIALMKKYASLGIPMLIALTKIDIMPEKNLPQEGAKLFEAGVTNEAIAVSARRRKNLKKLENAILAMLPDGDKLYTEDIISDKSEKFMIAEIMREKILLGYEKEIPHGVAIVVNEFARKENGVYSINL